MGTDKAEKYKDLVKARKEYGACGSGVVNPSRCAAGRFDSEEIGVWSRWQGNLDAPVMVIGQDWGDVKSFEKQEGKDTDSATNKMLCELLAHGDADLRIAPHRKAGHPADCSSRTRSCASSRMACRETCGRSGYETADGCFSGH